MTVSRLVLIAAIAIALIAAAPPPDPDAPDFGKQACAWAGELAASTRADDFERELFRDPNQLPPSLHAIGAALAPSCARRADAGEFVVGLAKANARRLSDAGAPWTRVDMATLLAYQLVDPVRFAQDAKFRPRVLPLIPREMDGSIARALRERQMQELNETIGFDFDNAERVELAWQLVPRASASRKFESAPLRIPSDYDSPIEATVFVLPSRFFTPAAVETFLTAQREATPGRRLVVITDDAMKSAVGEKLARLRIDWIDSFGRDFTPWPRDPFTVARRGHDDNVVFLMRPNLQEGREEDANMPRQIISGASDSLDRALGKMEWTVASTAFHNGQVLLTPDVAWITLHALEVRNLERMGRRAIPRKQFDTAKGIDDYLALSKKSIAELEKLYGRKVRVIHALPESGKWAARKNLIDVIYGGADFDLDSLVTLVPGGDGKWTAFVADLSLDDELFRTTSEEEWSRFRSAYGIASSVDLPAALAEAQRTKRAKGLDAFVDLIAQSLEREGMTVERLPLLLVPVPLLADTATLVHRDFVVGWNNMVFERTTPTRLRANAFATYLDSVDRDVVARFRAAGVDLQLLPPLVRSVILNGGYRCASNNVRK
ncbi:MAG: hypothetical protein DMF56_10815 [Acidobacteria bacterium]|nr:MAG: hypothetical protein DMF56_10815 [Acidobacteriota bacterium]